MINVASLYFRYKKTSDADIKEHLEKIRLVRLKHNGAGTPFDYYPLTKEAQDKIAHNPRGVAFRFNDHPTETEPMTGLTIHKEVTFLVKSSSRFFLKDDIGEVFDQIDFTEFISEIPNTPKFKAIAVKDGYEELAGTDGEHFLMTALLLK